MNDKDIFVAFTIGPHGELSDLRIEQSSRSTLADNAALKAVQDAAPFGPFPQYTIIKENQDSMPALIMFPGGNLVIWHKSKPHQ